ncbi:MAG: formylmethanofuran--tetrahydromethanopterin formyltransferase [Candidatus Methanoliparum thermophilum]|uniref:Formylmethanofuran--tetrahydromethanopterin formyltransferase n=1 Tax=Methanoliparum thermophilum TaxID=2491083 RepID=A0A520KS90_METT2|nr:MAG: formylmethanofuran--tetrahydromethanopterin formyltransferase [Candidatus Methanoliparum thermophilum]
MHIGLSNLLEDTYAEAFKGIFIRILVTRWIQIDEKDRISQYIEKDPLRLAAYKATATPSVVMNRVEGGIEGWIDEKDTPDGNEGVILQFWKSYDKKKDLENQINDFFREVSIRIRQDILSVPFTRIFDWNKEDSILEDVALIDTEEFVGRCGGGYEYFSEEYGREVINIPLMMGYDFKIDRYLRCGIGVSGGNLWYFCDSLKSGWDIALSSIEAIKDVEGVITPFYVCPSGSMPANYPPIGPPTNYPYCPTLKDKCKSNVPDGVRSIPEIVINGITEEAVKEAMKKAIISTNDKKGLLKISAGNYDGKLGDYKIYLKDLI